MRAALSLSCDASSASAARRFVRQQLGEWGLRDVEFEAELLVSELVTNAVLHARTPMRVEMAVNGRRVRVDIVDGSGVLPARRSFDSLAATGRGLTLVDQVSGSAWGVEARGSGKSVWFELHAGKDGGESRSARHVPMFDEPSAGEPDLDAFLALDAQVGGSAPSVRAGYRVGRRLVESVGI